MFLFQEIQANQLPLYGWFESCVVGHSLGLWTYTQSKPEYVFMFVVCLCVWVYPLRDFNVGSKGRSCGQWGLRLDLSVIPVRKSAKWATRVRWEQRALYCLDTSVNGWSLPILPARMTMQTARVRLDQWELWCSLSLCQLGLCTVLEGSTTVWVASARLGQWAPVCISVKGVVCGYQGQ